MKKRTIAESCGSWDETDVAEYHDRVMAGPARKRFESHLLSCPGCRAAYSGLVMDTAVLRRPDFFPGLFRRFFAALKPDRGAVIRMAPGGLSVLSTGSGRRIVPEFATAVRGDSQPRIRGVILPFSTSPVSGSCRLRYRDPRTGLLGFRIDRCVGGSVRIALARNGEISEEKTLVKKKDGYVEFMPVTRGRYEIRIDGKKAVSLKIV